MRDTEIETAKRDISKNPIKKTIFLGFYGSYIKYQTFANEEFKEVNKVIELKAILVYAEYLTKKLLYHPNIFLGGENA